MPTFEPERQIERLQMENTLAEIASTIYTEERTIAPWERCRTGTGRGPEAPPDKGWEPVSAPHHWGAESADITVWFRARFAIPEEWKGRTVAALLRPGGESLCYLNGHPTQGLCSNRDEILLQPTAQGGEPYEVLIEAVNTPKQKPGLPLEVQFEYAKIAVKRTDVFDFYWDARVAFDVAVLQPEGSALQLRLFRLLQRCLREVDLQHLGSTAYFRSLEEAGEILRTGLREFPADPIRDGRLFFTGHSHVDTAWLWPIRETKRKCGRTVASMLQYMDEYPEFRFSHSQPQTYVFLKEHYPELYERIQDRVREGRWECLGASWVEQDNNVPAGESLIRQILYGNEFFDEEFGVRSRVMWLLDSFGFTWSLPQILKKAEVDYFFTTKMTWSRYNRFPHSLFWWRGIDGSQVLSLMTEETDNLNIRPDRLVEHWEKFKTKELAPEYLASYGFGDGGGGPTKEMLECGRRLQNIAGIPAGEFGTVEEYFARVEKEACLDELPVWNDELYLELHRACQISQARTKRLNRRCEIALREAEIESSLALASGGRYDAEALHETWRKLLLNQFHDILPGSSITEVHETSERELEETLSASEAIRVEAQQHLLAGIDTQGPGQPIVLFNTLSWERSESVELSLSSLPKNACVLDHEGRVQPLQVLGGEATGATRVLFQVDAVPPMGHAVFHLVEGTAKEESASGLSVSESRLENEFLLIELSESGDLARVYDKQRQREVLEPGSPGNILQLFDDRPFAHDAWDIDFNIDEKAWEFGPAERFEIIENGPLRGRLHLHRRTEKSELTQDIVIYADRPQIEFETTVDWHEKHTLLKASFPLAVHSPHATYEIQFGAITRPTTRNTPWEKAQFECTALRWADISEGDYGVSLLNDSKYSYDCRDNVLRLSLLRAPTYPDPKADEGLHRFTYSLFPHPGDWRAAQTVRRAAELNQPLHAVLVDPHPGALPAVYSWAQIDRENIVLETVKKAENGDDLILRLYEAHGCRGTAELRFASPPSDIRKCNLVERKARPIDRTGAQAKLEFTPFEIKTVRVTL